MHEAKVNTKNSDLTSLEQKNKVFATDHAGVIETPYGTLLINRGSAKDQAHMRACQLSGLLRLMQTDMAGAERFCQLGSQEQDHLIWLGVQMADELHDLLHLVAADAKEGWV